MLLTSIHADEQMSIFQQLGLGRCAPIYQFHSLLGAFQRPRETTLREALQQYVDSFSASEIDEHWLSLRDRYQGQDWTKGGLLKDFEHRANGLGQRLMSEFLSGPTRMPSLKTWNSTTVFGFRHEEIATDYPTWLETEDDGSINVGGVLVPAGYFDVFAQFKFLWIAGAVKSHKDKTMMKGLRIREGR